MHNINGQLQRLGSQLNDFEIIEKPDNSFEERLQRELCHPKKTLKIVQKYQSILKPVLSEAEQKKVEDQLVASAQTLGSFEVDYLETFHSIPELAPIIDRHRSQFTTFFTAIRGAKFFHCENTSNRRINVVVTASLAGGGHIVPGQAIVAFLNSTNTFNATFVPEEALFDEQDAFLLTNRTHNGEPLRTLDVYTKIFQAENNHEAAYKLWGEASSLQPYAPDRRIELLLQKAVPITTDAIIAVAHHHPFLVQLAFERNIPISFVHTDYAFNPLLIELAMKIDRLVYFCVPTMHPEFFNPEQVIGAAKANMDSIRAEAEVEKVNASLKAAADKGMIVPLGYPIRSAFVKETDPIKLEAIRSSYGVAKDAKVIIVAMGREGITAKLLEVVSQIQNEPNYTHPLHVFVICGKNGDAKAKLSEHIQNTAASQTARNVQFQICGLLDEQEMADIMKIATLIATKPGGSTAGEVDEMETLMLSLHPHDWEKPNISYLRARGLVTEYNANESLGLQINRAIANPPAVQTGDWRITNWQANLAQHIKQITSYDTSYVTKGPSGTILCKDYYVALNANQEVALSAEELRDKYGHVVVDPMVNNYNMFINRTLANEELSPEKQIPKKIHLIWLGAKAPRDVMDVKESWETHHPGWDVKLWGNEEAEALIAEMRERFPKVGTTWDKAVNEDGTPVYAEKADVLRYCILYKFGGLYVDTDLPAYGHVGDLHKFSEFYIGMEQNAHPTSIYVGNAAIGSRANHPRMQSALENLKEREPGEPNWKIIDRTGPGLMIDQVYDGLREDHACGTMNTLVLPPSVFYPLPSGKKELAKAEHPAYAERKLLPWSLGLHLWNLSWYKKQARVVIANA